MLGGDFLLQITNQEQLKEVISKYSDNENYVFRGQNRNYSTEEYQSSFLTSFDRERCIPIKRATWIYSCHNALKAIIDPKTLPKLDNVKYSVFIEALLQHYGWKSRYIDLTKDLKVSFFFAAMKYLSDEVIHGYEDCFEMPVFEKVIEAHYDKSDEEYGYIYIFNKQKICLNKDEAFIDLTKEMNFYNEIRPLRQSGCLLSNQNGKLNEILDDAIVEKYEISSSLLLEFCKKNEITQEKLFPSDKVDPLYWFLLSLPRRKIIIDNNSEIEFEFYKKLLDIPEYSLPFEKIKAPAVAYFSEFWIVNNLDKFEDSELMFPQNASWYKCYPSIYATKIREDFKGLNNIIELLDSKKCIVIEFNDIYKNYFDDSTDYSKGIRFDLEENIITVYEIEIDFPGKQLRGMGCLMPRHYKVVNKNSILPIRKPGDCPCNDEDRHNHNLFIGEYFAQMIKEKSIEIKKEKDSVFVVR